MTIEHLPVPPEQRLRVFLEATAATTGEAFFRATVQHLATVLDVTHAFIAQCADEHRTRLRTLAFWQEDGYVDNFEYDVAGTPCEAVLRDQTVCHGDNVQDLFPTDANLRMRRVRSYVAVPVHDAAGAVVGHLGALNRSPMSRNQDHWVLRMFAARAGSECERLRSEQRLREREAEARNLLDSNFDGIVLAIDGKIAYANRAVWKLAGCSSADDMIGRSPADLIVAEQREQVVNQMTAALTGDGRVEPTEYVGRKIDGSTLAVEVLGQRIMVGGHPAILAAVRDITARQLAERARSRAEAELRRVLDAVPDLIWSGEITTAGVIRFRWASPVLERVTGRPPAFFEGDQIPWLAIVHPADRKQVKDLADRLISGERHHNEQEYRIVRPDGTIRWVRDSAVVTEGPDGIRHIQGVVSDISDARALSEQLARAQRLDSVGQLAAGIAHNLNNALTAISGYSELLLRDRDQHDPARQNLEAIQRVSEQAAQQIGQLLTFSRTSSFERVEFSLNDVAETTRGLLGPLMGDTRRIDLRLDEARPTVRGDRAQIEQVITDLVLNARDAMPDGGVVTFQTRIVTVDDDACKSQPAAHPGAYALLRVADTGTGMDADTVARVFEPFFTTKEPGKGVGLGLSMVHGAVAQNGGFVTVSSAPGQGTTFDVYLPTS